MSAKEIRQVGVGELLARLEELKGVLAKEGLFDSDRKVSLPRLPNKVGLICGRNTDAMKDVVENARRRWPAVEFEIREVAVQGSAAVVEVSQALAELEARADVDVIIITRGGGSFEDLLPFSDESLVRLAGSCLTPIVSAIGHEKDSPLLDLVADYRASTPTDAAKRVVPDIAQEIADIDLIRQRLFRKVTHLLDFEISTISHLTARPVMKDPMVIVTSRVDQISTARDRAARTMTALIDSEKRELKQVRAHLRSLSPQSTLDRGYSVATLEDGAIARDASKIPAGSNLKIRLAKGSLEATVERRVD
jgi:exodeoxyribonuclease VII large subunit